SRGRRCTSPNGPKRRTASRSDNCASSLMRWTANWSTPWFPDVRSRTWSRNALAPSRWKKLEAWPTPWVSKTNAPAQNGFASRWNAGPKNCFAVAGQTYGDRPQDGQTPLDPDEKAGLIPEHLATKGDLNDWEQENILRAVRWLKRVRAPHVLSEGFCRELHRQMFGKTWAWAGTFRKSDKNIGCDWT